MTSLIYIVQGGTEQEQGLNKKCIINIFLIEWKFENKKEKRINGYWGKGIIENKYEKWKKN